MSQEFFDNRISFPSAQEIIQRLSQVNDQATLVETFYMRIAMQLAGKRKRPIGVVMIFALAVHEIRHQDAAATIKIHVPRWLEALIDDISTAESAKELWQDISIIG